MTPADIGFLLGPIGGVVLAPLAMVVLAVLRSRWGILLGVALWAVLAVTWLRYWFLWGEAFDYVDTNKPTPVALVAEMDRMIAISSISVVALLVTSTGAAVLSRRVASSPSEEKPSGT